MTDVIYLAPLCQEHERMWCEHDAPVDCECIDGPHPWIKYVAALRQPTQSNIFDACDVQKHTLIVDQDYSSHTVKVKSLDDSQPTQGYGVVTAANYTSPIGGAGTGLQAVVIRKGMAACTHRIGGACVVPHGVVGVATQSDALREENERLREHLISALDTLKDAEVCDDNCGPCNEARAALEQSK